MENELFRIMDGNDIEKIKAKFPRQEFKISVGVLPLKKATGVLGKMIEEMQDKRKAIDETISYNFNALAEVYLNAMEEYDSIAERIEGKCEEMCCLLNRQLLDTQVPWDTIYISKPKVDNIIGNVDLVVFPYFRANTRKVYQLEDSADFYIVVKFGNDGYKLLQNKYELLTLVRCAQRNVVPFVRNKDFGDTCYVLKDDLSLDEYNGLIIENFPELVTVSEKYMPDFFRYFDKLLNIIQNSCCLNIFNVKLTMYSDTEDGCKAWERENLLADWVRVCGNNPDRPLRIMDTVLIKTENDTVIKDNISKYMYFIVAHLLQIPTLTCHDLCREIADYIEERYRENK